MEIKTKRCNPANHAGYRAQTKYLVIHWTSNQGDTAENNATYFAREIVKASAHYFVDEKEIWSSVPEDKIAYHVGAKAYKHPECRNANSIGIEICMTGKGYVLRRGSIERAAMLTRTLMDKYGIPIENVIRHHDVTGKDCPAPMVSNSALWAAFRAAITQKEDDTVTQEQFNAMYNNINPIYTSLSQVPDYWQQETKALMDIGAIRGDGKTEIAIRDGELKAAIIARRCVLAAGK